MNATIRMDLRFPADWERIEPVREAVSRCLQAVYADGELQESLQMVSAELLENAVKYGAHEDVMWLSIEERPEGLVVGVTNAIPAGSPHVDALRERIAWIAAFADPAEAFVAAMAEIFARSDPYGHSGLGLARVAHEGGCRIECDESQPGQVTVRAVRALHAGKRS